MTWFETLTGCPEDSPEQVRRQLVVEGDRLRSLANGREWQIGRLEIPSLMDLRERVRSSADAGATATVREWVADVRDLHCDASNAGAMFQVASQFNLLEMVAPSVTPEDGVGGYESDMTQGPACAVAAGAGTIYRNYFVPINGRPGQTADQQIDCLADIGKALGNENQCLWRMVNGYCLPADNGLQAVNERLAAFDEAGRDQLRGLLKIGLQLDTQITIRQTPQCVSQAYCSAMPVGLHPTCRKRLGPARDARSRSRIRSDRLRGNSQCSTYRQQPTVPDTFGRRCFWQRSRVDTNGDCPSHFPLSQIGARRRDRQLWTIERHGPGAGGRASLEPLASLARTRLVTHQLSLL